MKKFSIPLNDCSIEAEFAKIRIKEALNEIESGLKPTYDSALLFSCMHFIGEVLICNAKVSEHLLTLKEMFETIIKLLHLSTSTGIVSCAMSVISDVCLALISEKSFLSPIGLNALLAATGLLNCPEDKIIEPLEQKLALNFQDTKSINTLSSLILLNLLKRSEPFLEQHALKIIKFAEMNGVRIGTELRQRYLNQAKKEPKNKNRQVLDIDVTSAPIPTFVPSLPSLHVFPERNFISELELAIPNLYRIPVSYIVPHELDLLRKEIDVKNYATPTELKRIEPLYKLLNIKKENDAQEKIIKISTDSVKQETVSNISFRKLRPIHLSKDKSIIQIVSALKRMSDFDSSQHEIAIIQQRLFSSSVLWNPEKIYEILLEKINENKN